MSASLNKAIVIGNLGKDPEIRSFQNGGRAASFSLATSESWKDKETGERKERTEWHRVSILNDGLVTVAEKYLRKGSKVYVEGRMETRKWTDREGVERYSTEIVLRPYRGELVMLEGRKEDAGAATAANEAEEAAPPPADPAEDQAAVPPADEAEQEQPVKQKKSRAAKCLTEKELSDFSML
jgi:single-strand DNA-binding protein